MSKPIKNPLKKYPFLTRYTKAGLVNFNALARFLFEEKKNKKPISTKALSAHSMELRRTLAKLPKENPSPFDFSPYALKLITRSHLQEIILPKTPENQSLCQEIIAQISQTQSFLSLIQGEREIVIMTDVEDKTLSQFKKLKKIPHKKTSGLSFISVNFPLEMREIPGIYSLVTSSLSENQISIHAFHTIGGEILILVKNENLLSTQEVLQSLFQ